MKEEKLYRSGNVVYNQKKEPVAYFTKGAWYKQIKTKYNTEYEPIDVSIVHIYDSIPSEMKSGDTEILSFIEEFLDNVKKPILSDAEKQHFKEDVSKAVVYGFEKYGPFDPTIDKRDLRVNLSREAINASVYTSMNYLKSNKTNSSNMLYKSIIHHSLMIWLAARNY